MHRREQAVIAGLGIRGDADGAPGLAALRLHPRGALLEQRAREGLDAVQLELLALDDHDRLAQHHHVCVLERLERDEGVHRCEESLCTCRAPLQIGRKPA